MQLRGPCLELAVIVNKTTAPGSGTFKTHRMLAGPPRGFERGDRVHVVVEGAEAPFAPPAAGGANRTRRAAGKTAETAAEEDLEGPLAPPAYATSKEHAASWAVATPPPPPYCCPYPCPYCTLTHSLPSRS